jgi:hypothetical protein
MNQVVHEPRVISSTGLSRGLVRELRIKILHNMMSEFC